MHGSFWLTGGFIITCCLILVATRPPGLDRVGTAVHVLRTFGDLDLEFRVTPRNGTERWIFNSDPVYVLKDINIESTTYDRSTGKFRLEMCKGKDELLESYFRYMSIEGVERPWKAFSRGWSVTKELRTLGLSSAPNSEYGYILLKLDMKREEVWMTNQEIEFTKMAQEQFDKIAVNDTRSVLEFHKKFGTHYVRSYSTGNSLFQVLEYRMSDFEYLEKKLSSESASNLTVGYLSKYFSPSFAKEIGQVMVTSGNTNSTLWANGLLSRKYGKNESKFASLFSLMWKPWLLEQLDKLESDTVLSLNLELIDRAVQPTNKQQWFKEITHYMIELNEEHV